MSFAFRQRSATRRLHMCLAIPGEIVRTYEKQGLLFAETRFAGITREVCLEVQPDAAVGDFVLVHVGVAIAKIGQEEAERAWAALSAIDAEAEPS